MWVGGALSICCRRAARAGRARHPLTDQVRVGTVSIDQAIASGADAAASARADALCSLHFCGHGMQRRQRRTQETQWQLVLHVIVVIVVAVVVIIVGMAAAVVVVVIVQAERIEATAWMLILATGQVLRTVVRWRRAGPTVLAMLLAAAAALAQCKGLGTVDAGTGVVLVPRRGRRLRVQTRGGWRRRCRGRILC